MFWVLWGIALIPVVILAALGHQLYVLKRMSRTMTKEEIEEKLGFSLGGDR